MSVSFLHEHLLCCLTNSPCLPCPVLAGWTVQVLNLVHSLKHRTLSGITEDSWLKKLGVCVFSCPPCQSKPPWTPPPPLLKPTVTLSLQADKRAHHNALERKRRDHIKDSFHSLRDSVPALQGEKVGREVNLNLLGRGDPFGEGSVLLWASRAMCFKFFIFFEFRILF